MSMRRKGVPVPQRESEVGRAFVALAGPTLLYVVYFVIVYLLGEAGCKVSALSGTLLGSPVVTTVTLFLSIAAWIGLFFLARLARRVKASGDDSRELAGTAGVLLSTLSALFIGATVIFILVFPPC